MSTKENSAGLGVNNRFGPRTLPEGKAGKIKTFGEKLTINLEFTGADLTGDDIEMPIIPAGFIPEAAYVTVRSAATAHGGVLKVGTDGSESSNGFEIGSATLGTAGVYKITSFAGTWGGSGNGDGLAAATTVAAVTTGSITGGELGVAIEGYMTRKLS